jgi:hypothetical protein
MHPALFVERCNRFGARLTTERYLGSEQDIEIAVNDNLGL